MKLGFELEFWHTIRKIPLFLEYPSCKRGISIKTVINIQHKENK